MLRSVSLEDKICLPGVLFGLCFLCISTKMESVSEVIVTTPPPPLDAAASACPQLML